MARGMMQLLSAALLLLCALPGGGSVDRLGTRSRLAFDDGSERLPGWKGEVARVPSKGEQLAREDRARGTWVEVISWRPRAFVIHNFMSPEECLEVIKIAKPFMRRSTVVDSVTGESKVDPIRTSEQTFLARSQYELITKLEERLTRFTMLPWQNGEDMQILKYGLGQKYDAHHDVGELDTLSGKQLASDGGYRVVTALMYLTDTEEGGETAFPDSEWADPALAKGSWSECAQGCVAARARAGEALVFYSITPANEIDPASMHTGCPVIKGEKWTMTKWIHAEPFRWTAPSPPPDTGGCRDLNPTCRAWANSGECKNNPTFMVGDKNAPGTCVKACKKCEQLGLV